MIHSQKLLESVPYMFICTSRSCHKLIHCLQRTVPQWPLLMHQGVDVIALSGRMEQVLVSLELVVEYSRGALSIDCEDII